VAILLNLVDPRLDLARCLRDLAPALADQDAAHALVALAVPRGALGLGNVADPVHVLGDSLRRAKRESDKDLRMRLCFTGQLRALFEAPVDEANGMRLADACVVGAAAALAGAKGDVDELQVLLDSAMGDEERRAVARDGVSERLGPYLAEQVLEDDAARGIQKLLVAVDPEFHRVPASRIAESLAQLGNQRAPTLIGECAVAAAAMPGARDPGPLGIDAGLDVATAANRVSRGR